MNRKLDEYQIEVYYRTLIDLEPARLEVAVMRCLREDTFFPSPGRLNHLAEKSMEEKLDDQRNRDQRQQKALHSGKRFCSLQQALADSRGKTDEVSVELLRNWEKLKPEMRDFICAIGSEKKIERSRRAERRTKR
jgi:hypothetical protein